jgi:hypothetical protein
VVKCIHESRTQSRFHNYGDVFSEKPSCGQNRTICDIVIILYSLYLNIIVTLLTFYHTYAQTLI